MSADNNFELPEKGGKIKFTRTVIYNIDAMRDDSDLENDDKALVDKMLDWLAEDMTVPVGSDTVIVTDENGKELKWVF